MISDRRVVEMLVQAICGGVAGGLSTACSYPFTNLRLRRIAEDLKKLNNKENDEDEEAKLKQEKPATNYFSDKIEIVKFTLELIKKHGLVSLYDGMTSSIFGSVVQYAIYFCMSKFSTYFLDYLEVKMGNLSRTMLTNLLAATCTAIITNPIWVVNARMAQKSKDENNVGNVEMVKLIYREEGLSGFFKGITPSLILTLVPVMQFTSYELLKKSFSDDEGKISTKHIFMVSFISKLLTILLSYPLMTLKALFQSNSKLHSQEVWRIIMTLIKLEGLLGFYKGFGPKLVGSLINNTVLMFTYERLQTMVRVLLTRFILKKRHSMLSFA